MRRMRVLFVIAPLAGGPRAGIRKLLLYIDKQRFEPTIAYFHIRGVANIPDAYWQELRSARVQVQIFPMRHRLDPVALFRLFSFLSRGRFDVVYLPYRLVDTVVSLMARILGIPVLVSKHGFPQHNTLKSKVRLAWHNKVVMYLSEKLSTSLAHRVRTVSESNKLEYTRLFKVSPDRIVVIPNGIELEDESTDADLSDYRRIVGAEDPHLRLVGLVGSLVPIKGHPTLIRAAVLVKEKMPKVRWLIICDVTEKMQTYQQEIEQLIRTLCVEDVVWFAPYRQDAYAILDLVVVPSFIEDCPHVVLEAMKYGVPVVASRVGGIPELVVDGETGVLVTPQDPQALAEQAVYLLQKKELAHKMGMQGRKRLEANFEMSMVMAKLEAEFEALVRRPKL